MTLRLYFLTYSPARIGDIGYVAAASFADAITAANPKDTFSSIKQVDHIVIVEYDPVRVKGKE